MNYDPEQPLMVQNDFTVWLESRHRDYAQVSQTLARFAELLKNPDPIHTYRITPMTVWNAMERMDAKEIVGFLRRCSKFEPPDRVLRQIMTWAERYGLLKLEQRDDHLLLGCTDKETLMKLAADNRLKKCWKNGKLLASGAMAVKPECRGLLKQELIKIGYPVEDLAGYSQGESLVLQLADRTQAKGDGKPFALRDYQEQAIEAFYRQGTAGGGNGVVVLPCGSGKTIVGIAAIAKLQCATLILTTNGTSVQQWKREILDKTDLTEDQVGEYSGTVKQVCPVTIATYQILTYRRSKQDPFKHMALFNERDWGLIIYDEVHLLPAPVFRVTANIQATRRLGLTATLIREDGQETEVFSLIGPKRYDAAWRELESEGWIAKVECAEIRVPLPAAWRERYRHAEARQQFRIACENPAKLEQIRSLLRKHENEPTLIIGQYIKQLRLIAEAIGAPIVCGETPHEQRETLYEQFRNGQLGSLVVSKVANFAVDLPDARVAIQVSGSYGSRQEEAQRLGRVVRPKKNANQAWYYALVSANTKEEEFAMNRQLFLVEQGYRYRIEEIGEEEGVAEQDGVPV
ncbi:MAG: helicase [Paenibacillaceae bacterium]|jgi:DNA excision repair protein ERCC-3|nr:helicase [Paenibacillaceae bacterium]